MKKEYDIFLKKNGISIIGLTPVVQDASSRKYFRLENKDNLLIMDSKLSENNNERFISISNFLNKINLSAPKVFDFDKKKGLLLIEDMGKRTFSEALKNNISETFLYKKAIDTLITLHKNHIPRNIPYYSEDILISEVNLFIEWFCPSIGLKLTQEAITSWKKIWKDYLNPLTIRNNAMVLRDFHADNLFWLPDRLKEKQVGIIDFQDALVGHIAYDLSSLLQDVRRNVSNKTRKIAIEYFIEKSGITDKRNFIRHYRILTAQRNAKIAGIFVRLAKRDGKTSYLSMVDKAVRLFKDAAKEAELLEILSWLKSHSV